MNFCLDFCRLMNYICICRFWVKKTTPHLHQGFGGQAVSDLRRNHPSLLRRGKEKYCFIALLLTKEEYPDFKSGGGG
jgi:hypothetical protein